MTRDQIDRVFGRDRLKMVTGDHVEVFREAASDGSRRRYTKRFLDTRDGDFGQWTEREWRILARLIGHGIDCVPEVVQFDRGAQGGPQIVQTYDAGATVDQWATILPVERDGQVLRHVFEDCAHWWALAHHCLRALSAIHELSVVHLDIKGDNVCIPVSPGTFDPNARGARLSPRFESLALIDFAFSLISRERLATALPIGWQTEYDYQSPRLLQALEAGRRGDLQPTRELDWRCDAYSLAAMLRRYMPAEDCLYDAATGWSSDHASAAKDLILALRDAHDRDGTQARPYPALMAMTAARLAEPAMAQSLAAGWCLARDRVVTPVAASPITPLTRLAPSLRVMLSPRAAPVHAAPDVAPPAVVRRRPPAPPPVTTKRHRALVGAALVVLVSAGVAAMVAPTLLSRVDWPGDDVAAPPPVAREEAASRADPPAPETAPAGPAVADAAPTPVSPPVASASPGAPASRAPTRAARPAEPARALSAPAAAATSKVAAARPPVKIAMQQAPARIRFHQEAPSAGSVTASSPPAPAQEAVTAPLAAAIAAPAPEPAPRLVAPPPAQVAQPAPRTASPAADVRGLLTMLFDLGRRDRGRAPIEERVVASNNVPRVQPEPAPVEPAPAARPEPAPPAPPPPPAAREPAPPAVREPAPRASPPAIDADLAAQARRLLADSIPYSAARAQGELSRVMWIAANASRPGQERAVVDAVRQSWSSYQVVTSASTIAPAVGRQLGEDARHAYLVDRDMSRAFDLQMRAFGANPRDPEVAGNLAFLLLKVQPSQAESARQLAIHAIALAAAQRTGRSDDWTTLAIANALTGRDTDATNALYVAVALSRNLDASCKAAVSAVDAHGERMSAPVSAMMARIRDQGRERESTSCAMPARYVNARTYY